jgi:iron complex transport system ATP-binding protein
VTAALLEARELRIARNGRTLAALDSWRLAPGEIWAVLGVNGAGKSTLLRTLAGLLPPATGEILLDGRPLGHRPRRRTARLLAYLGPEETPALPFTAWELVLQGRHPHLAFARGESLADLLHAARALRRAGLYPLRRRPYATLSSGERRRVSFATLLAQNPRVFLLDEPTSALDLRHQAWVYRTLGALADEGCGIVLALHDPTAALRFASHVLLLDRGRTESGRAETLLDVARLAALYGTSLARAAGPHGPLFDVLGPPRPRLR